MAWIATPGEDDALERGDQHLRALLERARDPATGRVDHILAVHGLHPEGLAAHLALYTAAMRGTPGLPRVDRELVALVVSAANSCRY